MLFEVMAEEINTNGLLVHRRSATSGYVRGDGSRVRRDDVRFVLEVVSEPDPWFEQGAS